jgi:ferredoxin
MGKYKIEYDRNGCIGAGVCAALCEKHWVMADDGKADLVEAQKEGELDVKEIDEEDLQGNKEAAEGCPANVIHIINKETGEKII